jgi:hypothetical protein
MLLARMPRLEEIGLHGPVLIFTALISAVAALGGSILPATQASAGLERGPSGQGLLRDTLIVAEISGTVVLLVSAGLLIRSFVKARATKPGL